MQLSFVDPGIILLGKVEKSLNDLIFPLARNAYNSYYKQVFDVPFDSFPEMELVLVFAERNEKVEKLRACLESIKQNMDLKLTVSELCLPNNLPESWVEMFSGQLSRSPMYLFVLQEPLPVALLLEPLVRQGVLFEVMR